MDCVGSVGLEHLCDVLRDQGRKDPVALRSLSRREEGEREGGNSSRRFDRYVTAFI